MSIKIRDLYLGPHVYTRYVDLLHRSTIVFTFCKKEKKKEILPRPMTKAPTPTDKFKQQRDKTKTPSKTSITQRLRTD